ncbi:nicotinamide riboside transporter PnuC [Pseudomonas sp. UBA2684]|uniref:nicotinamide riboside transporter PnuC n=1 Tax=Pseudomonas sp. UBA2684 TaxID=1947311 RepID=UPI0025EFA3D5|nr:nicotinamide riboside transporter PnuC [Pseudomonas sp. UBA2684]|tara:strand:- start:6373 stop:6939 length:567 start_codon:yes stop_codon:yes gene_type:complete
MSSLEILAAALGTWAVWLTVRQNPWCWPIGLVMVLLYAWIFFEGKLYSNMLLQGVYAALQLYGWWQWTRGGEQQQGLQVSRLSTRALLLSATLGSAGALGLGYLMASFTDAAAPWQDAALSAFSLVAQVWMAQKRLECWPLWVVLDLLFVALFLQQGLYLTAGLYALFTVLAISGWLTWRRDRALATV